MAANDERPNILLILADDFGPEGLSCYGGTSYKTPHIDALAASGTRFERCYATPLCSPSRVQLLTGRYGIHTGWKVNIDEDDPSQRLDLEGLKTIGQVLRDAGYATAWAGKWQLAQFDHYPDHLTSAGFSDYRAWMWLHKGQRTSRYWNPMLFEDGRARVAEGRYGDDLFSDFVLDFAKRHRERRFFVVYSTGLTHEPWGPTPDSRSSATRQDRVSKTFGDNVAYLDKLVGKLVAGLEAAELRSNTLVLFAADNGTDARIISMVGDKKVKGGKAKVSETGARVPLIASWPGRVPAGRVTAALVDFSDFLPTLAELAGATSPSGLDGRSFVPLLLGQSTAARPWVFVELGKEFFVRETEYRLNSRGQLFRSTGAWSEVPSPRSDAAGREAKARLEAALKELGIERRGAPSKPARPAGGGGR